MMFRVCVVKTIIVMANGMGGKKYGLVISRKRVGDKQGQYMREGLGRTTITLAVIMGVIMTIMRLEEKALPGG